MSNVNDFMMRRSETLAITRTGLLATVAVAVAVLTIGCSAEVDEAAKQNAPVPKIYVPGSISSVKLESQKVSVDAKFELLSPEVTGVRFVNPIDTRHPLKRLYSSGFGCGGIAIGDVNGDGRPDLYLVSGPGRNRLFVQEKTRSFHDVTSAAGVDGGARWGTGASLADVDNDGDLDLFVCNYDAPNQLFINHGDGTFSDESRERGVDVVEASLTAAFCDYDRDGDLDFYLVANRFYRAGGKPAKPPTRDRNGQREILPEFAKYYRLSRDAQGKSKADAYGRSDRLFLNDGNGKFREVSQSSGIAGHGYGLSATWWDFDNDGWSDLYVGNDFDDPDKLYHNNGDGTFTDVLAKVIPHTAWFSMGADCGDLNNDGLLDLLSLDMSPTSHYMQKTTMGKMNARKLRQVAGPPPQIMRNALFLNAGRGKFLEGAYLAGLAESEWSWAAKLADLDNDGLLDVFISNGMARSLNNSDIATRDAPGLTVWDRYEDTPTRPEQNLAFRNNGDLEFHDVSGRWGLNHVGMSYASAMGDLDGDGDLDLVVANLDEPVSIYRNNLGGGNRLAVRLVGNVSNSHGLGARVEIRTAAGLQVRELSPMTGFLSCDEPLLHFGLGSLEQVRHLSVRWPSGHVQTFEDLATNRLYTIAEPDEVPPKMKLPTPDGNSNKGDPSTTLFESTATLEGLRHLDREFDDFAAQPLLPNKLSQLGPGIASGDVDNDGDADFFLGQGAGIPGLLLLNAGKGDFHAKDIVGDDKACEDMGAIFFDADADGDLDLYVVSGSVEHAADDRAYADRLYLNDGTGGFTKAPAGTLPEDRVSGSCVVAADYDRDGDLDLFVGGRVIPGKYPLTPRSRLLRNDDGKFTDATNSDGVGLHATGLVTGAVWSDANGDGWIDLLVTHEWGPVKLWLNHEGKLVDATKAAGLSKHLGWWNGIAARDLDGDTDIDYVVPNFGLNTKYHASQDRPALLYYGDFEGQGQRRLVEAEYENKTLYPIRGKSCSTLAIPSLGRKYATFRQFALAPLADIYTPQCLQESHRFAATTLASSVLINNGQGQFEMHPLPRLAQISPSFGVALTDVDGDGHSDCYLVQNFFNPQPETGRMDSGLSLLLRGNGDGTFAPVWPNESGLTVPGDAKSLVVSDLDGDGWPDFLIGVNNDDARTFVNQHPTDHRVFNVRLKGRPGNPTGVGAVVTLKTDEDSSQTAEVYAGSGYLSQSTSMLTFGLGTARKPVWVRVRWPDGTSTSHPVTDLDGVMVVEQPQDAPTP